MEITIPLPGGLSLMISEGPVGSGAYATRQMQHGFLLFDRGVDLSEEAVGFGLPVVKRGLRALFPGRVTLTSVQTDSLWRVQARFTFNLEERLSRGSSPGFRNRPIYAIKNLLAAVIRLSRPLRRLLTAASSSLRSSLGIGTVYEEAPFGGALEVQYTIECATGVIQVRSDASELVGAGVTEVILMNEQGGHSFDSYRDTDGTSLDGARIGAWDRVTAREASMISRQRNVIFSVAGGEGARLYRGREVVGSRLAWSGFGYSFTPDIRELAYVIRIARVP